MIATGGEGDEGEKVNLKICIAEELNPGLQRERRDHYTKDGCYRLVEIFHYKYYVAVFFQFSHLKGP